jgi:capsule polysaccharide export protein KpsE/RkpR
MPSKETQNLEPLAREDIEDLLVDAAERKASRERHIARMRLLWEHRRFLTKLLVCGLIVGTLIAFLIPARYTSTARLMPPDSQSGSGMALMAALASKGGSGLGMIASDLLGAKSTGAVFLGILSSRTMQDRLVEQFDLRHLYGHRRWEDARDKLADRTGLAEDRVSGIITLSVTDHDSKRAAAMNKAYIDGLNSMVSELSTSSARTERVFLEGRLTEVKGTLEQAEKDFSEFASKNTAINIPEQGKAMVVAAATLQGQLIAAQSELEGLKQIYTSSNVRVRSTQARVDELRHELDKIGGKNDSAGNSEIADQSLYPSIRQLPLLGVTWADLYRRTKVQEAVFEALTQEYELAKVEEAKEIPTVKVLDEPSVPEKKSFPPRLPIIIFGSLLSLLAGVVWVLGSARWAAVNSQDSGKMLAEEVFATFKRRLPWISQNGSRRDTTIPGLPSGPNDHSEEDRTG